MKSRIKIMLALLLFPWMLFANTIDTKNIALDLQIDWNKKQVYGSAVLTIAVLEAANEISLDAAQLSIHAVKQNNQALKFSFDSLSEEKNLTIKLNKKYLPGEELTLTIDYNSNYVNQSDPNSIAGSFGKGLRFFLATTCTPKKRKQLWSNGEPNFNKYWFPCNETVEDIHTTEICITVDSSLTAIASGQLVSSVQKGNKNQFRFVSDKPHPNYMVALVVGDYAVVKQKSGATSINTFGYQDEIKAIEATVVNLPKMMRFLEQKTGVSYPTKVYNQVVVQDYPFPGLMGQHHLGIISDNYIDDFYVHKDFKYLWDGVALQALANQWFGSLLMPASMNDLWLNSAFAQYFAGLYTAYDNTEEEYLSYYLPFEKQTIINDWNSGYIHPIVPKSGSIASSAISDNYSKYRGALILRMLENELGEGLWWNCVRSFIKKYANKQYTSQDFFNEINRVSGTNYNWFFDQWIHQVGLPALKINSSYSSTTNALKITITQSHSAQDDTIPDLLHFCSGKLVVETRNGISIVNLLPKETNEIQLVQKSDPEFVNVNFKQILFAETTTQQNASELFAMLNYSQDILARQNAIALLLNSINDSAANKATKEQLNSKLKDEINSTKYWRYRLFALNAWQKINPIPYDSLSVAFLKKLIQNDSSWVKSSAINLLGKSLNKDYLQVYVDALHDPSDRVVNSAAIAIGRTKHEAAYDLLIQLESQKSWKNQNRISALNGLSELKDHRLTNYALECLKDKHSARWYLATPVWDYPFAAVQALKAINKQDTAFPLLFERFKAALNDDDWNDIFQMVQLIDLLQDKRGLQVYELLYQHFASNEALMSIIKNYEKSFRESLQSAN